MQATTMTNISEKSIVMDCLFFLGWYLCCAPGTNADADADADADAGIWVFENEGAMKVRSCYPELSRLESSGKAHKIYNSDISSQNDKTVGEALIFPSLRTDFVQYRNGRGKRGLGTGGSETLRGTQPVMSFYPPYHVSGTWTQRRAWTEAKRSPRHFDRFVHSLTSCY